MTVATHRGASSNAEADALTLPTVAMPPGTVSGDRLWLCVRCAAGVTTLTFPGFTYVATFGETEQTTDDVISKEIWVFTKVAGGSEPASYTADTLEPPGDGNFRRERWAVACVAVADGDPDVVSSSTAFNMTPTVAGGTGMVGSTTHTLTAGTVTKPNSLFVGFFMASGDAYASFTNATLRSEAVATGNGDGAAVVTAPLTSVTSVLTVTGTKAAAANFIGVGIVVPPDNSVPFSVSGLRVAGAVDGQYADLSGANVVEAPFSDSDPGDYPTLMEMRYKTTLGGAWQYVRLSDGTLQGTAQTNNLVTLGIPQAQSWTVPAGLFSNGGQRWFNVRYADAEGEWGAYGADTIIVGSAPPSAVITAPVGTVTDTNAPTAAVSYTDAEGDAHVATRWAVVDADDAIEAGWVDGDPDTYAGAAVTFAVQRRTSTLTAFGLGTLANNADHVLFVQVEQTGGLLSAWDAQAFRIAVPAPPAPATTVIYDSDHDVVLVEVTPLGNLVPEGQDVGPEQAAVAEQTAISNATVGFNTTEAALRITSVAAGESSIWLTDEFDTSGLAGKAATGLATIAAQSNSARRTGTLEWVNYDDAGNIINIVSVSGVEPAHGPGGGEDDPGTDPVYAMGMQRSSSGPVVPLAGVTVSNDTTYPGLDVIQAGSVAVSSVQFFYRRAGDVTWVSMGSVSAPVNGRYRVGPITMAAFGGDGAVEMKATVTHASGPTADTAVATFTVQAVSSALMTEAEMRDAFGIEVNRDPATANDLGWDVYVADIVRPDATDPLVWVGCGAAQTNTSPSYFGTAENNHQAFAGWWQSRTNQKLAVRQPILSQDSRSIPLADVKRLYEETRDGLHDVRIRAMLGRYPAAMRSRVWIRSFHEGDLRNASAMFHGPNLTTDAAWAAHETLVRDAREHWIEILRDMGFNITLALDGSMFTQVSTRITQLAMTPPPTADTRPVWQFALPRQFTQNSFTAFGGSTVTTSAAERIDNLGLDFDIYAGRDKGVTEALNLIGQLRVAALALGTTWGLPEASTWYREKDGTLTNLSSAEVQRYWDGVADHMRSSPGPGMAGSCRYVILFATGETKAPNPEFSRITDPRLWWTSVHEAFFRRRIGGVA